MNHLIAMPHHLEDKLAKLHEDRQHFESRAPMQRQGIRLLDLPWPWPWALLERECPVVSMTWRDLKQKQKHLQLKPVYPNGLKEHAWLAIKPGMLDVDGASWLERQGIIWPSLPDAWRSRVVMMARFEGHTHAARDHWAHRSELGQKWCHGTVGWWLSNVVAIEPMEVAAGEQMGPCLYHLDPEALTDLRERYQLATAGVWRHTPLIER